MFEWSTSPTSTRAEEANATGNFPNSTELLIDDEDEGQEESGTSVPETGGLLLLGRNQFQGCMSNLYTRR